MRRLSAGLLARSFAILLLLAVSFQSAWAAAASCCTEGEIAAPAHFGHHVPTHHAPVHHEPALMGVDAASADQTATHAECLACHMAAMHAVFASVPAPAPAMPSFAVKFAPAPAGAAFWSPSVPERPDWSRRA